MSDLQQQLSALLRSADIRLTDQQKQQLTGYVEILHKWNKAYNLTSVRQPEQMLVRHIMDSIVVEPHLTGRRFIDVGTGPGFLACRWRLSARTLTLSCSTAWVSVYAS